MQLFLVPVQSFTSFIDWFLCLCHNSGFVIFYPISISSFSFSVSLPFFLIFSFSSFPLISKCLSSQPFPKKSLLRNTTKLRRTIQFNKIIRLLFRMPCAQMSFAFLLFDSTVCISRSVFGGFRPSSPSLWLGWRSLRRKCVKSSRGYNFYL